MPRSGAPARGGTAVEPAKPARQAGPERRVPRPTLTHRDGKLSFEEFTDMVANTDIVKCVIQRWLRDYFWEDLLTPGK